MTTDRKVYTQILSQEPKKQSVPLGYTLFGLNVFWAES